MDKGFSILAGESGLIAGQRGSYLVPITNGGLKKQALPQKKSFNPSNMCRPTDRKPGMMGRSSIYALKRQQLGCNSGGMSDVVTRLNQLTGTVCFSNELLVMSKRRQFRTE